MSWLSSDIHKALARAWSQQGLDTLFQSYWSPADHTKYITLNEGEAAPGTPFPYGVVEQVPYTDNMRMSGGVAFSKNIIRRVPFLFHIYATATLTQSAKQVAERLLSEVTGVYGGHPTKTPTQLTLDHGNVLNCQYQNDYSVREGDTEHRWVIEYILTVDAPYSVR